MYFLHPTTKHNASYSCITAAAGTCIRHNYIDQKFTPHYKVFLKSLL